mmetsp:Transcript_60164/g.165325  ORF Transcript_60164/g.165325 Transcript_60164/m.165325 type:complete len:216 (-) Transcript_60164:844-1491(-)
MDVRVIDIPHTLMARPIRSSNGLLACAGSADTWSNALTMMNPSSMPMPTKMNGSTMVREVIGVPRYATTPYPPAIEKKMRTMAWPPNPTRVFLSAHVPFVPRSRDMEYIVKMVMMKYVITKSPLSPPTAADNPSSTEVWRNTWGVILRSRTALYTSLNSALSPIARSKIRVASSPTSSALSSSATIVKNISTASPPVTFRNGPEPSKVGEPTVRA